MKMVRIIVLTALITAPMFASQRVEINCGLEAQATLLKTDFIREKFQVFKPQWIKQELIQLANRLGEFELIKRHQNLIVVNFQYWMFLNISSFLSNHS